MKRRNKYVIFMLVLVCSALIVVFSHFLFARYRMEWYVLHTESSGEAHMFRTVFRAYAVRRFVQRLNHRDPGIREGAAAALGLIGRPVKERFALIDIEDLPRLEKEHALAKKLAIPALKKSLKDPAERVRYEAACALARMGDDSGLKELLKCALRELSENYDDQRADALVRLGRLGYGEVIEILIDDLEKTPLEGTEIAGVLSRLYDITGVKSSPDALDWWEEEKYDDKFKEKELAFWKKWWQENKSDPRWSKRWKRND